MAVDFVAGLLFAAHIMALPASFDGVFIARHQSFIEIAAAFSPAVKFLFELRIGAQQFALRLNLFQLAMFDRDDEAKRLAFLKITSPGRVICQFIVNGKGSQSVSTRPVSGAIPT